MVSASGKYFAGIVALNSASVAIISGYDVRHVELKNSKRRNGLRIRNHHNAWIAASDFCPIVRSDAFDVRHVRISDVGRK